MPKHANKIERNILMNLLDYILFIYSVCVCICTHMYVCAHVHSMLRHMWRSEENFLGISSFFPPYRYISVSGIDLWSSAGLKEIPFTH